MEFLLPSSSLGVETAPGVFFAGVFGSMKQDKQKEITIQIFRWKVHVVLVVVVVVVLVLSLSL